MHSVSKHVRLSEPTTKMSIKTDPYCQQQKCSPMTLVSGNIRFMQIFARVTWREVNKRDSRVIENVDFQGFRALRLWHLRKCGQYYYIVLFSTLSPFHWPQNTWPWSLEWPFYIKFSLLGTAFQRLLYMFTVESVYTLDHRMCAEVE